MLPFRNGKRKHVDEDGDAADDDEDMVEGMSSFFQNSTCHYLLLLASDLQYRTNALLLHGPPISHLPTARLFAYAKHFDVQPMGLEWVDDNTCVFVFPTKTAARSAHRFLQKSATEDADVDGFVTAKPIPITFWPPEERINSSLGKGQGLKGIIRMRWALADDVKKRGAKKESEFYRKHGKLAGKEEYGGEGVPPPAKRRRSLDASDLEVQKAQLDDELDQFLAEDDPEPAVPASPPSRMRSDYISTDGRTLLERTSAIRAHPDSLASRITAPLPRRARNIELGQLHSSDPDSLSTRLSSEKLEWGRDSRSRGRRSERRDGGQGRRGDRPLRSEQQRKMTQQELDDEMDAFLNEKS